MHLLPRQRAPENARLYTLTDRHWRKRVEELSVMQGLTRVEYLPRTARCMRITLEWLCASRVLRRLDCLLRRWLKIRSAQGYSDELGALPGTLLPLSRLWLDVD